MRYCATVSEASFGPDAGSHGFLFCFWQLVTPSSCSQTPGSGMCQYSPAMSKNNIQVKVSGCMPKELGIKHRRRVIGRSKSLPVLSR